MIITTSTSSTRLSTPLKKPAVVSVETILVPDPGPGEALVRIQACGVCHTDLHYREGAITNDFPFLLGHEASGIVEQVGPNVTNVAPGDFVILAWRAPCGTCRSCLRGRPWYCFASRNAQQKMTRQDGTLLAEQKAAVGGVLFGGRGCGVVCQAHRGTSGVGEDGASGPVAEESWAGVLPHP